MKTRAALLWESPGKWDVREVELDDPKDGEVLVRMVATGLCRSDDHFTQGETMFGHYPFCGGHEGAGVVEAVGAGIGSLAPGDHIVTSFIPACGQCRWCAEGKQNLCDNGALMLAGFQLDGTFRMHADGRDVGQEACISTFSEWTVMPARSCIKIDQDVPLELACLLACGVPTGWGSAVHASNIDPGDTIIVMGAGGIGMNAVQGARFVGASHVVVAEPVALKRDLALKMGATEAFAGIDEAAEFARSVTNGQGAGAVVIAVGVLTGEHIGQAFSAVRKAGTVVVTAVGDMTTAGIPISLLELAMYQKRIQGAVFGMGSPAREIPRLVELFKCGDLRLEELVTRTYSLEQINEAYDDLRAGTNVRGVIRFPTS